MSKYEIIRNPDDDVWRKIVDLTYKDESWTLGYQDYGIWLEAFSTNGFILFAAITTDTQEVVGSVSLAAYGSNVEHPEVMTVGMFYVRPDHRGMGIGSRLFSELMDEANKRGGNVALNGVLPMSPKYASRYAFNKFNEWHPMPVTIAVEHLRPSMLPKDAELELVSINDVVLNQLYDYDLSIVGIMRRAYLNALFRHKQSTHKIAMKSGRITGFINARNVVGNYLSIGPFYADNNETACTLLRVLFDSIDNLNAYVGILICIPTVNKTAFHIIETLSEGHLTKHSYMASQFTESVIPTNVKCIFATTEYAMSYA